MTAAVAKRDQFLGQRRIGGLAGFELHHGAHFFTQILVRRADHGDVEHFGMGSQDALSL